MVRVLGDLVNAGAGSEKGSRDDARLGTRVMEINCKLCRIRQCILHEEDKTTRWDESRMRDGKETATDRQHERVGEERREAKEHRTQILYSAKTRLMLSNGCDRPLVALEVFWRVTLAASLTSDKDRAASIFLGRGIPEFPRLRNGSARDACLLGLCWTLPSRLISTRTDTQ
jgi:hypothetical protein